MKLNDLYTDNKGKVFQITSVELKGTDPWVGYTNKENLQEYTCRQEAFLARFSILPQSR